MDKRKLPGIVFIIVSTLSILISSSLPTYGDELLKRLFTEQKWQEMGSYFLDDSYKTLKNYFSTSKSVAVISSQSDKMSYKAKFTEHGEIGVITFEKKDGKFLKLLIRNQIRPLYFIENFKRYKVVNKVITIGDARFHFVKGYFYETLPFRSLLLFHGIWSFSIKPNDREEQLTLIRKFKRDTFTRSQNSGIFILEDKTFLTQLADQGEIVESLDSETQHLYTMYRDDYGILIPQFNEYWYLPFPQETNLAMFPNGKNSYFIFTHNQGNIPDTQLSEAEGNLMLLSYNAVKGLKFSFGVAESVSKLNLSLFFNPSSHFMSGTATIQYKRPSTLRVLEMQPGLKLVGNLNQDAKGLNLFRKKNKYYLMGKESDSLSLYYKGTVTPSDENFEIFKTQAPIPLTPQEKEARKEDIFYFLGRTENFYPNPGNEFFQSDVTVALPTGLNCLAAGNLVEKKVGDRSLFKFTSKGTKGFSMVVGNFQKAKKIKAALPVNIYTPKSMKLPKGLDLSEIKKAVNLFSKAFGPLELAEINMLFKEGVNEGGISNTGFTIVNLPMSRKRRGGTINLTPDLAPEKVLSSPVLIRTTSEDHILHELAHQWWGSVISWKSYHDIWLTEGLAHFSVLYFLKHQLPEKRFLRLVKKLRRWVYKHGDVGPIIYGSRINLIENNYEAYQSVIYNKSALVFLMLMDWIGEEEFMQRLRSVVDHFKYKSVSSAQFIRHFCGENKQLYKFFKDWVYSRTLPMVELVLQPKDKGYDHKHFKKVVLDIQQVGLDSENQEPFIFPLKLTVTTKKGTSVQSLVMTEKSQRLVVSKSSSIRSIDVQDDLTLVREKKQPNPAIKRY